MRRRPWAWPKRSRNSFDLNDLLEQMQQIKQMGPLSQVI